jgi:Family of unknown function (DUF6152)
MTNRSSIVGLHVVAALVAVVLSAPAVLAHHGWGENESKISEITGTVTTGVSLAGPHATMKLKDADGHVWDVTMAPPARTQRAGLKEGMIPVGSTVMVHGNRNKNPNTYEIKVTRVTYNGTLYKIYPERD